MLYTVGIGLARGAAADQPHRVASAGAERSAGLFRTARRDAVRLQRLLDPELPFDLSSRPVTSLTEIV